MFDRVLTICRKINQRGFGWLWARLFLEYRIPETPLGKCILPLTRSVTKFFRLGSFRLFRHRKNTEAFYLFYDLEISPITYDFGWVLASAENERKKLGLKYIKVIFIPGPNDGLRYEMIDYEADVPVRERHWRFYHFLLPMVRLIPSCKGITICESRQEALDIFRREVVHYLPRDYDPAFPTVHSYLDATQIKTIHCLRATPQAKQYMKNWLDKQARGRKVIAITLRAYDYMVDRNSNIAAWAEFAKSLDKQEYFPVIIPDTTQGLESSHELLTNFQYCALASWNIELRIALYELSYLNMGINNGPMILCWLNQNCRYLTFKIITESVPQTTLEALQDIGFKKNCDPIFATPYQKWVWKDDEINTLTEEFKKMCSKIERENNV